MGFIKIFEKYKDKIKDMFVSNQDLCKLIYHNVGNPLSKDNILNPYDLFKNNILFKYKNFENIKDEATFVTIIFMNSPINESISCKETSIIFTIVTHNKLEELEDGSNRAYAIADLIDEYMCGNLKFGITSVHNKGLKIVDVGNNEFVGYNLVYTTSSWGYNYNNTN